MGNERLKIKVCKFLLDADRLCGLVVRVPTYIFRGPGFDSRRYQIFWEIVGLERGSFSLVKITEEQLEWKSSGSGQESRINNRGDPLRWPRDTLYPQKGGTNFANKQRSLGRYSSLAYYRPRSLVFSLAFQFAGISIHDDGDHNTINFKEFRKCCFKMLHRLQNLI
jgi:hypothetical protein